MLKCANGFALNVSNITPFYNLIKTQIDISRRPSENIFRPHFITSALSRGLETIKFLLAEGVDVRAKDKNGVKPLDIALKHDCVEIVNLLLETNADKGINMQSRQLAQ